MNANKEPGVTPGIVTEIDTLISELQHAKGEGAKLVLLQVNVGDCGHQAVPAFAHHDPNMKDVYVIGGTAASV